MRLAIKNAWARSWRVLAAYGAFTAWGLICLCTSVLLIMGTKSVPSITGSLIGTLAGIVGCTVAGHFLGNVLALLRLRMWVVLSIAACIAIGIAVAQSTLGESAGFLVVAALAATGGYFGVASRMEIFAAWLPMTYAVGAAVLWMNNHQKVSVWMTGAKFAVWDAITFAFLTGAVLLFLVFLMTRHALALTLWQDAAKPGMTTTIIRAKAGNGSFAVLLGFTGLLLVVTAVVSPFLFRTQVGPGDVMSATRESTHSSTYNTSYSHNPKPIPASSYAYNDNYYGRGTGSATTYGGTGNGSGYGGNGNGYGGSTTTTTQNAPPPQYNPQPPPQYTPPPPPKDPPPPPKDPKADDDRCDPSKNSGALFDPACFAKLNTKGETKTTTTTTAATTASNGNVNVETHPWDGTVRDGGGAVVNGGGYNGGGYNGGYASGGAPAYGGGGGGGAGGAVAGGTAAAPVDPGVAMPTSDIDVGPGGVPQPNMERAREHAEHAARVGIGVVAWLVVLLGLLLTLAVFFRPIRRSILLRHLERPLWRTTPTRRVENLWLRALIALDDAGIEASGDETPEKLAQRARETLSNAFGEVPGGIDAAAKIVERVEYAGRGLSPDEEQKMRAAVRSLLDYVGSKLGVGKKVALGWATVRTR